MRQTHCTGHGRHYATGLAGQPAQGFVNCRFYRTTETSRDCDLAVARVLVAVLPDRASHAGRFGWGQAVPATVRDVAGRLTSGAG
jgi:hypothetical protein